MTYHIERATFPQWDGINRTANIAIATENEFNQISAPVQDPSLGTVIPHLNFQASNVGGTFGESSAQAEAYQEQEQRQLCSLGVVSPRIFTV